jgi:hypothetical protein
MKKIVLLISILACTVPSFGQVGINTSNPSATLDVNGTIRIREFASNIDTEALMVLGIDKDGNLVEIEVGENIILEENTLRVVENRYHTAVMPMITEEVVDNFDALILPGEPNDDKKIIRLVTDDSFLSLTGLKAGEDGQMIWLMAFTDRVKLLPLNGGSDPENQFLINNIVTFFQYEMVQLVYDGTLQKWMLMAN